MRIETQVHFTLSLNKEFFAEFSKIPQDGYGKFAGSPAVADQFQQWSLRCPTTTIVGQHELLLVSAHPNPTATAFGKSDGFRIQHDWHVSSRHDIKVMIK